LRTEQETGTKKREGRSPSYPDFGLEEAIDKARRLWVEERRSFAPIAAIQGHWGHKPNTGPGIRAIAALKGFGLLTEQGRGEARQAKLSDLAFRIIIDDRPDSQELANAIKEAALTPPIIRGIWEEYKGHLPSDATLRYVLRSRGFSEVGADALIRVFRSTIEFAKLQDSDNITGDRDLEGDVGIRDSQNDLFAIPFPPDGSQFMQEMEERTEDSSGGTELLEKRVLHIPLLGNKYLAMQLPVPLTEGDWQQMLNVLNAMKPGLITTTKDDGSDHETT